MGVLEFVGRLVDSLAWPTATVVLGFALRSRLGPLLGERLKAIKAGPAGLEMEWNQTAQEAEKQLTGEVAATEQATDQTMPLRLRELAKASPRGAVVDAAAEIESALRTLLARHGLSDTELRMGMRELSSTAVERELISASTHRAIEGLSVLRNLAAHGRGRIEYAQAVDFLALADAVMYSLTAARSVELGRLPDPA
ncbi:hypothetical protein [Actinokineospora sp. NPDC004072]